MLNPPRDEQVFEDLCLNLFGALWQGAQVYGRRGHDQKGIDLYGRVDGEHVAVQCKKREGKLRQMDVEKDISSARALDPPLARLIFATTAKRDTGLQDFVRGLEAPFEVQVWFWDDLEREIGRLDEVYRLWEPILGAAPPLVSVDQLPSSILPKLIGRENEIELLEEAWRDPQIKVQSVVAVGGAGKTALVHHWMQGLERAGWKGKGAAAAFAWSFYSQGGGDDRQASGDAFIAEALRFFGEEDPPKTPRDRGLRLADLVRRRRTLLILDGLEPLQHPPTAAQAGKVKDPAVAALLRSLASDNPGLLLVTTREPVADLRPREGAGARTLDLEKLSPQAGSALLGWLGVKGKDGGLEEVSLEVHGHAFTLTILGTFLRDAHEGDVRAWKDVQLLEAAGLIDNTHAERVMAAYASWFGDRAERQILSLLGLFDRPADAAAVQALLEKPPIPGLTDRLVDLGSTGWKLAVNRLRQARLLLDDEGSAPAGARSAGPSTASPLDAHPLVREHFGRVLERQTPEAYQAGHLRLYRHYAADTDDLPETLDTLQPLYLAIGHCCHAGHRQEAYDEVYRRRVRRGNEAFSVHNCGAFGADLNALASFFDRPWDHPARELRPKDRAWLLNEAGYSLKALGRLAEAVDPLAEGFRARLSREEWEEAAASANNLADLSLTLGQVDQALLYAQQAVELAERSEDLFKRIALRGTVGESLHAAGELAEAEAAFREAEALQAEYSPDFPKLYSLRGYRYCDLLLSRAAPFDGSALAQAALAAVPPKIRSRCEDVFSRAIEVSSKKSGLGLHSVALQTLGVARATLALALATGNDLGRAAEPLHNSVRGLRAASQEQYLPLGLLARAALHRFRCDEAAAEADLAEALEIAERGSMKLHECDTHLEWARLRLSLGDRDGTRRHFSVARVLIATTGYHRRDREVRELGEALEEGEMR